MKSLNNIRVFDRHRSHLHCPIEDLAEAISNLELTGDFLKTSYAFPNRYGFSECVETISSDEIVWEKRLNRKGLTRFVLDREPVKTNILTVVLMRKKDYYVILTAFWGKASEPEPWDSNAFQRDPRGFDEAAKASKEFWENHALVK